MRITTYSPQKPIVNFTSYSTKFHFHQNCRFAVETLAITLKRHESNCFNWYVSISLGYFMFFGEDESEFSTITNINLHRAFHLLYERIK